MKEFYFQSRGEYANYMALMEIAHDESVPPELMMSDRGISMIKMDIGQNSRYNMAYLGYYLRSLVRGYPKNIIISDYSTRL